MIKVGQIRLSNAIVYPDDNSTMVDSGSISCTISSGTSSCNTGAATQSIAVGQAIQFRFNVNGSGSFSSHVYTSYTCN